MRKYAVMLCHPNDPTDIWVGKIGTKEEAEEYIRRRVEEGEKDYLDSVVPLEEGAELEPIDFWLQED